MFNIDVIINYKFLRGGNSEIIEVIIRWGIDYRLYGVC